MTSGAIIPIRRGKREADTEKRRPAGTRRSASRPLAPPTRAPAAPVAALPPEDRARLLAASTHRRFPKGSTVFAQGNPHTTTFVVESGLVRTYYTSATGKEVTMAYWSDGDLLGGPNFLTAETNHVWSARAVEDATIWCIAAEELERLVNSRPLIARFIIDSMTVKLFWVSGLLQGFGTQSVFLRLAHLLLKLAEMYGEPTRNGIAIRYHFTQEDLANLVGATRQWVSTTMRHFQRDGIIYCDKRRLEIHNVELLRRIVGEGGYAANKPSS
jgi:CRP-like cAMP-binding protein